MDRDNMAETLQESNISGKKQNLKAGDFILIGDVTEFGRKEVGDQQLFGILGRGKK
jgi:curli biogenesis system outer membrane secretion channel CsgG